ncbi:MAG: hypothetical protein HFF08_09690 [Oscillospiraceae bacterium]|nr:hypothetical protein [Oscillospiraceae bacterium]
MDVEFTYRAYCGLLELLREKDYMFRNYHNYSNTRRCVILRHDIDSSLDQAVRLAELEAKAGVSSTWFILLRTNFYNVASKSGQQALRRIQALGHEIGLHFDEVFYPPGLEPDQMIQNIIKECRLLSALLETRVSTFSMHRPSQGTLGADYHIPGIVNSYGKTFFQDFKYLSDSRRRWREPVESIVRTGMYERLHILTHAFWYYEEEQSLEKTIGEFIRSANQERYQQMAENISNIQSILREDEIN